MVNFNPNHSILRSHQGSGFLRQKQTSKTLIYISKTFDETDYNEPDKKQPILENFVDKTRLNKN